MSEIKYTEPPWSYKDWCMLSQLDNEENPFKVTVYEAVKEALSINITKEGDQEKRSRYYNALNLNKCVYLTQIEEQQSNRGNHPYCITYVFGVDISNIRPNWSITTDTIEQMSRYILPDHSCFLEFFCFGEGEFTYNHYTGICDFGFSHTHLSPLPDDLPHLMLKSLPYAEYLKSNHWYYKRNKALNKAFFQCQVCNSKGHIIRPANDPDFVEYRECQLHVHHRTYERKGHELPQDLIVLCSECHELFHKHGKLKTYEEMEDDLLIEDN